MERKKTKEAQQKEWKTNCITDKFKCRNTLMFTNRITVKVNRITFYGRIERKKIFCVQFYVRNSCYYRQYYRLYQMGGIAAQMNAFQFYFFLNVYNEK